MKNFVIVANVYKPDSAFRMGARVEILSIPGNPDHVEARGLSHGGRIVTKWTSSKRLRDIRSVWDLHPYRLAFETKEAAERCISERFPRALVSAEIERP